MLRFERQYWDRGLVRVAGVDEAGRGPLAGPVVAGAVIFDPDFAQREEQGLLNGLTDSKKLSESRRESFFTLLSNRPEVSIGVGMATVAEIDSLNILNATYLAMARAAGELEPAPEHILVDGRPVSGLPCDSEAIVHGDSLSLSVAAASVAAKVVRDRHMKDQAVTYPQYGFEHHKGYGTEAHIQALFEHGPCPIHRRTFRPVRDAEGLQRRMGEGN